MRAWQAGEPGEVAEALRGGNERWPTAAAMNEDAERIGIPPAILHLADAIAGALGEEAGKDWPERFVAAIAPDADLGGAFAAWAHAVLTDGRIPVRTDGARRDRQLVAERYRNSAAGLEDESAEWEGSFTTLFQFGGDQLAMHASRPPNNASLAGESMVATVASEGGPVGRLADALIAVLEACGTGGAAPGADDAAAAVVGKLAPGAYRVSLYAMPAGERLGAERHIEARTALEAAMLAAAGAGARDCIARTSRAEDDADPVEIRVRTSARRLETLPLSRTHR